MKTFISQLQAAKKLLLEAYREHLLQNAGLQPSTCKDWTFLIGQFLNAQFKPKATQFDWTTVTPLKIWGFFRTQAQSYVPTRLQALATALRSFFRFLYLSGRHPQDLSEAIPRIADPGREELPRYLSEGELNQVLQSVDQRTPAGQREMAVLLCLARLGLRAGEVAHLNLEDVDWRAGVVHLCQTKNRQERLLPLPQDLGRALVRYLRQRPTATACRRVFLSLRDGGPVGSDAITKLARRALHRAAITCERPGAHLFRYTVASHLVQKGASLKAVADWLGHRSLSTTQLYAKVNLPMLRAVAQPWPGPEAKP
jgi:site-specific recombinase XerD